MDCYQINLLICGLFSLAIAIVGILFVDSVLKPRLVLGKRLAVYAGITLVLCGYSLFGIRLHKYREWNVITSAAAYHNVSMYHAAKRATARAAAEKRNIEDADRLTGVAPVPPSSDEHPGL